MKIDILEFEEIIGLPLSLVSKNFVETNNFSYELASKNDNENALIKIMTYLLSEVKKSGPEYQINWEKGWGENLDLYLRTGNLSDLIPKFVRKNDLIRFKGACIKPEDSNFETNFVTVLRDTVFRNYFSDAPEIWEFGAGTGLNMVHLSQIFPDKKLVACDWAASSVAIIKQINENLGLEIESHQFDIFKPTANIVDLVPKNSALFTIGTMEQIGERYLPFLSLIMNSNFKIVVHIETNFEIYDENRLLDFLAIKYIEKRNWLRGYFEQLHMIEKTGKIAILSERKTFGTFYHDGYTITVWEKLDV